MPTPVATPPTGARGTFARAYTGVCAIAAGTCLVADMVLAAVVILGGMLLHWAAVRHQR